MDRLPHERTVLADIASEDRHTAHANGQGVKNAWFMAPTTTAAINLSQNPAPGKISSLLPAPGRGRLCTASTSISTNRAEHHIFGNALQPALQVKA